MKEPTEKDYKIYNKIEKLASKDKLFYTKNSLNEISKKLGLKESTLRDIFLRLGVSIRKKRDDEFINYFYTTDFKDKTLEDIAIDLNFTTARAISTKLKHFFGLSFKEFKRSFYE